MCSGCKTLSVLAAWAVLPLTLSPAHLAPAALSPALLAPSPPTAAALSSTPDFLRVCADPNNLPFSNQRGEGFENKIAALVARDLNRPLTNYWLPQRRGFLRHSLDANVCDVVIGVPAGSASVLTTRRYYRSSYAFLSKRDRHLRLHSFDAGILRTLTIGIQLSGDDYNNPPAAQALAVRHLAQNVRGFTVYGDYSTPDPQRDIVDAVADGRVDVAIVWGPVGAYYAQRAATPIDVTPVAVDEDGALRFTFDIAMGVRRDDATLRNALNGAIARRSAEITRILRSYGVPLR